ncbi:putative ribonuclease H-like domain-containing protein [Tanacetum coccineum]
MLADFKLPTTFWNEAVNTACYVQNRVIIVKPHNKTPYELFRGRTPALSFMKPFGCHVSILNTLDHFGKFDGKSDDGFFVGYSLPSKAFRVYNIRTRRVEENLHIKFLEDKPIVSGDGSEVSFSKGSTSKETNTSQDYIVMPLWKDSSLIDSPSMNVSHDEPKISCDAKKKDDEGVSKESGVDDQEKLESSTLNINTDGLILTTPNTIIHKDHSLDQVIGDLQSGVQTRGMTKTANERGFLIAVYEGKTHEDLHTSRIEAIRLFLAYASFMGFMVYQIDVKSAFLYGQIEEEVYVCQPLGFEDPDYPDKVYKVVKALYGLHQAPRAWYETLAKYLLDNRFHRGKIDQTLFIKKQKGDILLLHVYVDDIIFGSTKKELCLEFEKLMHDKSHISSMGELTCFLGLQVKQKEDGIFISQDKYVTDILKKFGFQDVRTASTPMDTEKHLLKDSDGDDVNVHLYRSIVGSLMYLTSSRPDIMFAYPRDSPFDLVAYSDSDYAGASLDRKSTIGGCQLLRCRLISWQCKKQTVVATSSTEAEYVAAASCCGQDKKIEYLMLNASPLKHVKRGRDTKIPQSSGPLIKVGVEAVHKELGDRMERAATTASSLEAEQNSESRELGDDLKQGHAKYHGAAYTRLQKLKKLEKTEVLLLGKMFSTAEIVSLCWSLAAVTNASLLFVLSSL